MKRMTMTMGAVAAAAITGMADAAIIFFLDEALFDQALADAGKISKGIEDFEQALIAPPPSNVAILNDPLNINNLQGAFNPGDFIDNLTFQANTNGTPNINDPGVNGLNPRGASGLVLFGAGFFGSANVGLTPNFTNDSFDILSGLPAGDNHTALGMNVFNFTESPFPLEVRVFDKSEQQIGLISIQTDLSGSFLGILATGGETIGRVNLWSPDAFLEGVYDVQTYIIPAPSALALVGLAGLFGVRRRRRR
ncbi:MAG: PEP-CTERM sorting domain-containing protein [Planctomycetes bacterium]|nr:PEP-CTERM sorting domain-containing protein [Planctomycetota bacterium]